ncbi:MAG: hypothetical protein WA580_04485 [Acidimicrobiales bacterium]
MTSAINRYYDTSTGNFFTVDPDVNETGQVYAYAGDDPVDATDPRGLWSLNPLSDLSEAASDVGGAVDSTVSHHWRGIVTGVGIVAGIAAAATGVGAVIEAAGIASAVAAGATVAEASASAIIAGATATAAGSIATDLDSGACAGGSSAACVGRDFGIVGAFTGLVSTLGTSGLALGFWEIGSIADGVFQGLGAISAMFGITASIVDLTTTAAGAAIVCGS